jgi:hypothetical protein
MKEFDLRTLDEDGEVIDIEHFDTKTAALRALKSSLVDDVKAASVEMHDYGRDRRGNAYSDYTTVKEAGCSKALRLWNGEAE